ncbi:MAG: hypothetical protein PVJ49_08450 [Acidobacteriota bacterium]|jgi:hypothetical protein
MPKSPQESDRRSPARRIAAAALALGIVAGATLASPPPAQAQCAMCRSAFDSPEGRRMIRKYQIGIAFLLTVPFAAFGTVAFLAVRGKRKLDDEPDR